MLSNLNQNNVLRFFICDDNTVFTHLIKDCIERAMPPDRPYELFLFEDDKQLLDEWNKGFADAVLLDINMPYTDGFTLAERLQQSKPDVFVLFVTSYEECVFNSYNYHPFWFIRKNHLEELKKVIPKLLASIDAKHEAERQTFLLKTENRNIELDIKTLIYIESYKTILSFMIRYARIFRCDARFRTRRISFILCILSEYKRVFCLIAGILPRLPVARSFLPTALPSTPGVTVSIISKMSIKNT